LSDGTCAGSAAAAVAAASSFREGRGTDIACLETEGRKGDLLPAFSAPIPARQAFAPGAAAAARPDDNLERLG
jgi:hypothetical protein